MSEDGPSDVRPSVRPSVPPSNPPSSVPLGGPADGARIMLVALGLGALALGGWLVHDLITDNPFAASEDDALPALPEPGEPRTRAMVTTGDGFGWTWVNPQPRWMPTWYAVDAIDDGRRAVIVGLNGAAIRYEDQAILLTQTGTQATLRGVAWTSADEALAVGDDGAMVRIGRGAPRALTGIEVTLRDVVATGAGEALVVGDEGTVLRVGGERASPLEVGTDADLLAAFSRADTVFVVGDGVILRVNGELVTPEVSPVTTLLRGVGGCPGGSVYAAGDRGVLLRRGPDAEWSRLATHTSETFTGVSCDHGRVAAVATDGRVLLISGDTTLALPSGFDRPWQAIDGAEDGPSWLVGTGGRLATVEEDHVRTRSAGPSVPIRALGALGGALVAVGEWGRIVRQSRAGFSEAESPTEAGLASLIQLDASRLLAIGDFGALVDIRHDRATLLATPTETSLRDGVGDAEGLLLVGSGGAILRGTPGSLNATAIAGAGDLWAVAGSPSNAIAVGDEGLVFRLNGVGSSRIECDTTATLRDVVHLPMGVYAVGDEGTIARIEDDSCVIERTGGPSLHAIGLGPEGRPIAAGDQGTVLERSADGEGWTQVGVNVLGASIRTIWRSDRNVYLAGTGGVIVRHILVDGS